MVLGRLAVPFASHRPMQTWLPFIGKKSVFLIKLKEVFSAPSPGLNSSLFSNPASDASNVNSRVSPFASHPGEEGRWNQSRKNRMLCLTHWTSADIYYEVPERMGKCDSFRTGVRDIEYCCARHTFVLTVNADWGYSEKSENKVFFTPGLR